MSTEIVELHNRLIEILEILQAILDEIKTLKKEKQNV